MIFKCYSIQKVKRWLAKVFSRDALNHKSLKINMNFSYFGNFLQYGSISLSLL